MIQKIKGESPFQILSSSFSISPSLQNYVLQISADGVNYSDLFTVSAGTTKMCTGMANGSYYRLKNNESDVTVNWRTQCNDGQGGGSSTYAESAGTANISNSTKLLEGGASLPDGANAGDVVAIGTVPTRGTKSGGNTLGIYQYDGSDWQKFEAGEGAVGPQGPQGETGAQGPQGPAGANGQDGAQGPQGAEGAQGPRGIQGADGAQGPQGIQGQQGPKGEDGINQDPTHLKSVSELPESGETGDMVSLIGPVALSSWDTSDEVTAKLKLNQDIFDSLDENEQYTIASFTSQDGVVELVISDTEGDKYLHFVVDGVEDTSWVLEDGDESVDYRIAATRSLQYYALINYMPCDLGSCGSGDMMIQIGRVTDPSELWEGSYADIPDFETYPLNSDEELESKGAYIYNGSSWKKVGSSAYKIELSTSNPDDFTGADIANLNAFLAAFVDNQANAGDAYLAVAGNYYHCNYASFESESRNGEAYFALVFNDYINEIRLSFEDAEYTGGTSIGNSITQETPMTLCGFQNMQDVDDYGNVCDLFVLTLNDYALKWNADDFYMVDDSSLYEAGTSYRVLEASGHTIDFVYDDGNQGHTEGYYLVIDENEYVDWGSYDGKPYGLELGDSYYLKFQYIDDEYYHMWVEDGNEDEQPFGDYAQTYNQVLKAKAGTYSYDEGYQDGPVDYEGYRRLAFADEIEGGSGSQGPQGEAGAQGPAGQNGSQGPQGIQGADGAQGPQGPAGPAGSGGGGSSYIADIENTAGMKILEGDGVGYASADDGQGNPTQYTTIEPLSDGSVYVNNYTDDGQGYWVANESYVLPHMGDIWNSENDVNAQGVDDGTNVLKLDPDSDGTTQVGTYVQDSIDHYIFDRSRYLVGSTNIKQIVKITESDYADLVNNQEVDEDTFYVVIPDPQIGE